MVQMLPYVETKVEGRDLREDQPDREPKMPSQRDYPTGANRHQLDEQHAPRDHPQQSVHLDTASDQDSPETPDTPLYQVPLGKCPAPDYAETQSCDIQRPIQRLPRAHKLDQRRTAQEWHRLHHNKNDYTNVMQSLAPVFPKSAAPAVAQKTAWDFHAQPNPANTSSIADEHSRA